MKINSIQNISFRKIDPAIKEKIEKDIKCSRASSFPENNLDYLKETDKFILRGTNHNGVYSLEETATGKSVHKGTIEHFLKFDPECVQLLIFSTTSVRKPITNLYPNNFANTKFDKIQNGENIEYINDLDEIYDIDEDD